MRQVARTKLFGLTLALGLTAWMGAQAATVTVNPAGANVPGVSYRSINGAVDNLNRVQGAGGHGWGNGVNDTILLDSSTVHSVTEEISPSPYNPDTVPPITPPNPNTTLTIRSTGPNNAVVRATPNFVRFRVWDVETPGTYILENVTHIGHPTNDSILNDYRTVIRVDADDPGDIINFTARNCIVTANNGLNQPVTNYAAPFPAGRAGTFMRAFQNGDGTHEGAFFFTAENCVFAFLSADAESGVPGVGTANGGGIEIFRDDALANPLTPNATKSVVLRNCLITNCLDEAIAVDGASREATFTAIDCLFTNVQENILKLPNDGAAVWRGGAYNFQHCIFDSSNPVVRNPGSRTFDGTINLEEVTIVAPGQDAILLTNQTSGEATINLSDVIAFGINSLLRLQPDPGANSGPNPAGLTAASIATDSVVLGSQSAAVQTTLNNAVVTTEDPDFISTNITGFILGVTAWNSLTNPLFDVGNGAYAGLGTANPDLRGGAEFAQVIPASGIEDWKLYE